VAKDIRRMGDAPLLSPDDSNPACCWLPGSANPHTDQTSGSPGTNGSATHPSAAHTRAIYTNVNLERRTWNTYTNSDSHSDLHTHPDAHA